MCNLSTVFMYKILIKINIIPIIWKVVGPKKKQERMREKRRQRGGSDQLSAIRPPFLPFSSDPSVCLYAQRSPVNL